VIVILARVDASSIRFATRKHRKKVTLQKHAADKAEPSANKKAVCLQGEKGAFTKQGAITDMVLRVAEQRVGVATVIVHPGQSAARRRVMLTCATCV
jgi:hypothetical protein